MADTRSKTYDGGTAWDCSLGISNAAISSNDASLGFPISDVPDTGCRIVVDDLIISVGAALTVSVLEETTGTVKAKLYMAANTTAHIAPRGKMKLEIGRRLYLQTSGAGAVSVTPIYHSEA